MPEAPIRHVDATRAKDGIVYQEISTCRRPRSGASSGPSVQLAVISSDGKLARDSDETVCPVPDLQILLRDFRFVHQRFFPHQLPLPPFLINWLHVFLEL